MVADMTGLGASRRHQVGVLVLVSVVGLAMSMLPGVASAASTTGSFTGVVTDRQGLPVAGICVGAVNSGLPDAVTDASGVYTVSGLAAGVYRAEAFDCSHGIYVQSDFTGLVAVSDGATTPAIRFRLGRYGTISGTITDTSGTTFPGACAFAQGVGKTATSGSATADSAGHYQLRAPAGTYVVELTDCLYPSPYQARYFDDVSDFGAANRVVVEEQADTPGIDGHLPPVPPPPSGSFSGRITDNHANPVANVCVATVDANDAWTYRYQLSTASGTYTFAGLATGTYRVQFSPCTAADAGTAPEWYPGVRLLKDAQTISVTDGTDTAGIDVSDLRLEPGASMSGRLTDSTGAGIAGVCLNDYVTGTHQNVGGTNTDANGDWTISGVATGSYLIDYSDCGGGGTPIAHQFYGGMTFQTATPVKVTAPAAVTALDQVKAAGGTIAGTAVDQQGHPVVHAEVQDYRDRHYGGERSVFTDAFGHFRFGDLDAGTYGFIVYASDYQEMVTARNTTVSLGGTANAGTITITRLAPVVSTFSPPAGRTAGGTRVIIAGTNLGGTTSVTFGGVDATAVTVVSDNEVDATTPAHAAGQFAVVLTAGGVLSAPAPRLYRYR